jgi:hypothetical protein
MSAEPSTTRTSANEPDITIAENLFPRGDTALE